MLSLNELIAQGEHIQQDFKFRIDDQRKIARTLCAFANTKGGRLLIGVKDNRKIAGCNPQEEIYMIEGAAKLFCKPEVKFSSKIWQEDLRLVLQIDVELSENTHHKAMDDNGKWKYYTRIDDHTTVVNKILAGVWFEKKNKHAKPEKFDDEELTFLRVLEDQHIMSLSKLYRKLKMSPRKVDRLLVLLICWDLVEIVSQDDGIYYRIKQSDKHN
jgi:predicted HTH transcriptional regulator